ncbi:MAG: bacterio-opsin activator domain-containing protein [Halobacteriales archaeon]|nr:bacterio-opsin activator domain-containing protein [Halobacteriales archaeon]
MHADQEEKSSRHAGALDELMDSVDGTGSEPEEVLGKLVETVSDVCSPLLASVWTFEDDSGSMEPVVHHSDSDTDHEAFLSSAEDIAWDAYSDGSSYEPSDTLPDGVPDSVGTVISETVNRHGVLLVFLPDDAGLTGMDRSVVRSATSMVESCLVLSEYETTVEETTDELRMHEERADKLEEILRTILSTSQKLLSATTRTEIEQAVCRQLVDSPFVKFAWMGKYVESGDEMVPEYSTDAEYLRRLEDNGGTDMAKQVARSREPSLVTDLRGEPPLEPWREQALRYGFRSVMRVPILHKSSMYGVLTAYSDETIDEEDHIWSAVKDIGNIVGHAINTYETKTALVSDQVTEIRFRVGDPAFPAVRFASAVGGTVTFENATTQQDGSHRVYVSVECEGEDTEQRRETVDEVAERTPLVESYSHITTRGDAEVYSIVGDISFFEQILDRSGTLMELSATEDAADLLVELPKYASVKSFLSMIEGEYDDVDVLSTRNKEKEFQTESGFKGRLKEELTQRQLETLQTAYYSGYFDSPRDSTGQDIAEQLDVTQPTVTENIKAGQRKLLSLMFDE